MSNRAPLVEKLIWVYVYVGMALLGLGLAVRGSYSDTGSTLGLVIAAIGIVSIVVGVVLVYVRSRMKNTTEAKP